ncbi:MAG TPA: CDGSH iron-sulfur domain-containing protein [Chitinophagaceae bacterium]|nr:CDGSH iron-sulfur domain-containing protein [Chitinophagaceae bacterium]
MDKPKTGPAEITLEPGRTYKWCQCGLSKSQPFCDNSHHGTGLEPKIFSVITARKVWLCVCKKTKNIPYCDGSHNKI